MSTNTARCDAEARGDSAPSSAEAAGTSEVDRTAPEAVQELIQSMAARLAALSPQAVRAMDFVLQRLELGQVTYGAPDPARDWRKDAFEELLDLCCYRGLMLACEPRLPAPVYSCRFPTDDVSRGLRELAEVAR